MALPFLLSIYYFSITLEDVHRVCHRLMHKSPVQWTGLFILAGATGLELDNLPELHSGRSHELLDVSSILFLFDFLFTL